MLIIGSTICLFRGMDQTKKKYNNNTAHNFSVIQLEMIFENECKNQSLVKEIYHRAFNYSQNINSLKVALHAEKHAQQRPEEYSQFFLHIALEYMNLWL